MSATAPALPRARTSLKLAGLRAVFERDFLVFTSRPRFLLLRTLVVVLPTLVLLAMLLSRSSWYVSGSSRVGQTVFAIALVMVPALVMLLAPVLAASCIASERAMHTLHVVLASPVSPFAFVTAKFLSRLCVVLVLVTATLPLAGIAFLYGGVSGSSFLDMVAFAAGMAVLGTAAGIVASSWSRSVAAAAMWSYFLAIALPFLHFVVAMAVLAKGGMRALPTDEYLIDANPFATWSKIGIGAASGMTWTSPGLRFLAWTCALGAAAVAFAGWRVSRESAHEVAAAGGARNARPMRYGNPVLDRSLRGTMLHRPRLGAWLRLAFVLLVHGVTLGIAVAARDADEEWPYIVSLSIVTFVGGLGAMSLAAQSIAGERETGALDMLLATRLTTREVVWGKFGAVLLATAPPLAASLLYGVVAAILTDLRGVTVFAWFVSASVVTLFFAAVGTWCSAAARTAGRAVLRSYAFLVGGSVVHAVAGSVAMIVAAAGNFSELFAYVWGPSPFFVGIAGVGLSTDRHWGSDEVNMFVAWLLFLGAYLFVSRWLLGLTVSLLERRNDVR